MQWFKIEARVSYEETENYSAHTYYIRTADVEAAEERIKESLLQTVLEDNENGAWEVTIARRFEIEEPPAETVYQVTA